MGNEVAIPYDLSQDKYPASYRYYDSILMLIQEKINMDRRKFTRMKCKLQSMFDDKMSLSQSIGIGALLKKFQSKKQSTMVKTSDEGRAFEAINYHESTHAMQCQRSKYVSIDDADKLANDNDD